MAKPLADLNPSGEGRGSKAGGLFQDIGRALGRTAGRTKDALVRLGELGALHLAVKKLQGERDERLKELGKLAWKELSSPGGALPADDPHAKELTSALDRLDERIEHLNAEASRAEAEEDTGEENKR